jgi:hypothetical protein
MKALSVSSPPLPAQAHPLRKNQQALPAQLRADCDASHECRVGDASRSAPGDNCPERNRIPVPRRSQLMTQQQGSARLVVIQPIRDWACAECGGSGDLLRMDDAGPLCMTCADLDHLAFLPAGDTALTRRAVKASSLSAVVVRWSRRCMADSRGPVCRPGRVAGAGAVPQPRRLLVGVHGGAARAQVLAVGRADSDQQRRGQRAAGRRRLRRGHYLRDAGLVGILQCLDHRVDRRVGHLELRCQAHHAHGQRAAAARDRGQVPSAGGAAG